MLPTLLYIPHRIGPLPVFGFGWLLLIWSVVSVILLVHNLMRKPSAREIVEQLIFLAIVALAIIFVLPRLEARDYRDQPLGLPIRGYGMMLLLGVISGITLAARRAKKMGLNPDVIYSLAFWMFVAGILGARLFYVIEYWESFQQDTAAQTMLEIAKFTEGGLVVYGSVIGGLLATALFVRARKLPLLAIADLISPSLVIGLAFGRIGCLLNGCCFGGVCQSESLPALQFPMGSPPYAHQVEYGYLLGMQLERDAESGDLVVESVEADGLADRRGVQAGDRFSRITLPPMAVWQQFRRAPESVDAAIVFWPRDEQQPRLAWSLSELPRQSQPVHPTQIYAAINALLLLAVVWCFYPLRPYDGAVFALLMTLYPISRFVLEIIRDDEPGQWRTTLTISQWASLGVLVGVAVLWSYLRLARCRVTQRFG